MAGTGVDIDRTATEVMDTTHTRMRTPTEDTRIMRHIRAIMSRAIMVSLIITSAPTTDTMSGITARGLITTPTIGMGGIITTITTTVGATTAGVIATIGAGVAGIGTEVASMWLVQAS